MLSVIILPQWLRPLHSAMIKPGHLPVSAHAGCWACSQVVKIERAAGELLRVRQGLAANQIQGRYPAQPCSIICGKTAASCRHRAMIKRCCLGCLCAVLTQALAALADTLQCSLTACTAAGDEPCPGM